MASSGGRINSTETTLEMNRSGFHKGFTYEEENGIQEATVDRQE